jgi:hypothetical protein
LQDCPAGSVHVVAPAQSQSIARADRIVVETHAARSVLYYSGIPETKWFWLIVAVQLFGRRLEAHETALQCTEGRVRNWTQAFASASAPI